MSRRGDAPDEVSDVVVVGGGASGLSLARHLAEDPSTTVTLVEPPDGPRRPPERTWCYWDEGTGDLDEAVAASWSRLRIHGADGERITVDPSPLRYRMLRSTAFERLVHSRLDGSPGARVLRATADTVRDTAGGAEDAGT
uniref:FAD-dependent oxidoreductase n=1 Tax=Streptomyces prasinopilosus TaxID=67344 RepID=UPI000AA03F14